MPSGDRHCGSRPHITARSERTPPGLPGMVGSSAAASEAVIQTAVPGYTHAAQTAASGRAESASGAESPVGRAAPFGAAGASPRRSAQRPRRLRQHHHYTHEHNTTALAHNTTTPRTAPHAARARRRARTTTQRTQQKARAHRHRVRSWGASAARHCVCIGEPAVRTRAPRHFLARIPALFRTSIRAGNARAFGSVSPASVRA